MERKRFLEFVQKLRGFGFKVYVNRVANPWSDSNYAVFTDGKHIGAVYPAPVGDKVQLSTKHRPCQRFGSSFSVIGDQWDGFSLDELTREAAQLAFHVFPAWYTPDAKDIQEVRKWKDFDDWKEHSGAAAQYEID